MNSKPYRFFTATVASIFLFLTLYSCTYIEDDPQCTSSTAVIVYAAGYNNLTDYLRKNIHDICNSYVPDWNASDGHLFIFSHQVARIGDYTTPTHAYLIKVYRNSKSKVVMDTLVTYPTSTCSASAEIFGEVLRFVHANYKSEKTGVILSSHATGWLPERQYYKRSGSMPYSSQYTMDSDGNTYDPSMNFFYDGLRPQWEKDILPDVKSIAAHYAGSSNNSREIDLTDFAKAIPFKLDFMIFDACLMGGIEVAYELKDVCDMLVVSSAQVLAEGMDYNSMMNRLFKEDVQSGLRHVAEDFYNLYSMQTGPYQSAAIALVDCRKLYKLTPLCKGIFEKYREQISQLDYGRVQKLDPIEYFYDFRDIIACAGASDKELSQFDATLRECIPYSACTPELLSVGSVSTFSGLSMYLPSIGGNRHHEIYGDIDEFYKNLKWNTDTRYLL